MEVVIFEGKEYTKASVLAARFRYTSDYLGQLCRGKKVDARLVGRAWYINLDSLNHHRDGRYKNVIVKSKPGLCQSRAALYRESLHGLPRCGFGARWDSSGYAGKRETGSGDKNKMDKGE